MLVVLCVQVGLPSITESRTTSSATARFNTFCARPASAKYIVGLMSGTSLDGVDAVLAEFPDADPKSIDGGMKVIAHHFVPMPSELRQELLLLNTPHSADAPQMDGRGELHAACLAANRVAQLYASTVEQLLARNNVSTLDVLAIANHGQTVRHRPELGPGIGYTLQLSNNALLAELTELPVIGDFRSRDVAAGGTGAPLVPAFHAAFFGKELFNGSSSSSSSAASTPTASKNKKGLVVLNLGGIANVSILSLNSSSKDAAAGLGGLSVHGFDTGPANVLSDLWICSHRSDVRYDEDGKWAATGTVQQELLQAMLEQEPYFSKAPPKSTGRDLFHQEWLSKFLEKPQFKQLKAEDVAATLVEVTVQSVAKALQQWTDLSSTSTLASSSSSTQTESAYPLIVCGGGALNSYMLSRLRAIMPNRVISTTAEHGLMPEAVEAAAFAWLGFRFLQGQTANLPRVTGAKGPRILGAYFPA